jgi:hypothetical protein
MYFPTNVNVIALMLHAFAATLPADAGHATASEGSKVLIVIAANTDEDDPNPNLNPVRTSAILLPVLSNSSDANAHRNCCIPRANAVISISIAIYQS